MNEKNAIPAVEELTQEQSWLLLYSLITDVPETEWKDFAHDLIYKDRFSSSHKVIDVIKNFSEKCTAVIKEGQLLYRARIYHDDPLQIFLSEVFKDMKDSGNVNNNNGFFNMRFAAAVTAVENGSQRGKQIIDAYSKWQRKRFKGYNSSGSGAPPASIGHAGRINPERIRYLYLAEDPETAIYEVRPTIGQYTSVATFKVKEDIKIYDLAEEIKPQEGENPENNYILFKEIQRRFSEPNTGDDFRYLPTQFLGEMISKPREIIRKVSLLSECSITIFMTIGE